jgi:hypothetical protein
MYLSANGNENNATASSEATSSVKIVAETEAVECDIFIAEEEESHIYIKAQRSEEALYNTDELMFTPNK